MMRFALTNKVVFAAAVAAGLAVSASARTVAWYHFNELAEGVRADTSVTFKNAVDAAVGVGTPHSITDSTVGDTPAYFPKGAVAFPSGAGFYEPVSEATFTNAAALEYRSDNGSFGNASVVTFDNTDDAIAPESYTIEFFFKNDYRVNGVLTRPNPWQTIFCRIGDRATAASGLQVYALDDGLCTCLQYYYQDNGTNALGKVDFNTGGIGMCDGRWHHYAATWDKSTKTFAYYVDYVQKSTLTITNGGSMRLSGTANPFALGAYTKTPYGRFNGFIDDFRISDTVLAADKFLDARRTGPFAVLPETVVYQRFAPMPSYFGFGDGVVTNVPALMRNDAPLDVSLGEPTIQVFGVGYISSSETPVDNVSTGGLGSAIMSNDGSVALRTTPASRNSGLYQKAAPCWSFLDKDGSFLTEGFTAEMFFRSSVSTNDQVYVMTHDNGWVVTIKPDGLRINWDTLAAPGNFLDGHWHHFAFVHDKPTGRLKIYVDYKYRGERAISYSAKADTYINVGTYTKSAANETFYDADIDEVRLTKRILAPIEFLHPAKENILWDMTFDPDDFGLGTAWSITPTYSNMSYTCDTAQVPGAYRSEGPLGEVCTNAASVHAYASTGQSGGFVLPDPDSLLNKRSFTAEACFRVEPGANTNFGSDCVYLFCQEGWYVRLDKGGDLRVCATDWANVFTTFPKASAWADGNWHHFAFVQDREANDGAGELRAYLDYRLLGTSAKKLSGSGTTLYVGNGLWGYPQFSFREGWIDNVRVTLKALQPAAFVCNKPVSDATLVAFRFDGNGAIETPYLENPTMTSAATFVHADAGTIVDSEGAFVRENNGSLSLASGAASYSRLSLLERKDQTVEFFLSGWSAASGADLVALVGDDAAKPIWALRNVGGTLKVVVTAGGVVTEVASAGALPKAWTHFALVFEPGETTTAVKVYRDHALVAEGSFAGALAVDGLLTSSLKFATFDGRVDEFRVSRGALPVADMLYVAPPPGLVILLM